MPSRDLTDVTLVSEDHDGPDDHNECDDPDNDDDYDDCDEDRDEDEDEDEDELTSFFGLIGPKTKKLLVLRPINYWS